VREHNEAVSRIDFMDLAPEQTAAGDEALILVPQADGTTMRLRRVKPDYDPTDRLAAMKQVQALAAAGEIATGLLYVDPRARDMHQSLGTVDRPLNQLGSAELCPGAAVLAKINDGLR